MTAGKPRAPVEAQRRALLDCGFQPVAVETAGKAPVHKNWPSTVGLPRWHADAANTGVLCHGLRPLDIDVDDPDAAQAIEEIITARLGAAPVRCRANSGRRLLLYRAAEGAPKKRAVVLSVGKVEALGAGQQFVAYGEHPSGVPYEWRDGALEEWPFEDLRAIAEDDLARALDELADRFGSSDTPAPPRAPAPEVRPPNGADSHRAYGEAALKGECDRVAMSAEGHRNGDLFKSGCRLFELVAGGSLSESEVRGALENAARAAGLAEAEIRRTIESAWEHGSKQPRGPKERDRRFRNDESKRPDEQAAKPAGFPLRLYRDFASSAVKRWLVPNLLGLGEFSCFFGEPGSGKSVVLGDLALHVAANAVEPRTWFDQAITGGLAVFFALERPLNVERRALAFRKHTGLNDIPFALVRGPINFREPATAGGVIDAIRRAEDTTGHGLKFLGLDTVAAALCGGDENSPKDLGALVATLLAVLAQFDGAHIAATHHQPHDAARLRGHGVLLGALDLTDEVVNANGKRTATVRKNNDGPEGGQLAFTLKSIVIGVDEDGVATEAPLVVPDESAATTTARAQRKVKLPPAAQVALTALIEALDDLGKVPPESDHIPPNTKAVTVEQWRDYAYRRGVTNSQEARARQQAFNRAGDCLRGVGRIGTWEPFVWLTAG